MRPPLTRYLVFGFGLCKASKNASITGSALPLARLFLLYEVSVFLRDMNLSLYVNLISSEAESHIRSRAESLCSDLNVQQTSRCEQSWEMIRSWTWEVVTTIIIHYRNCFAIKASLAMYVGFFFHLASGEHLYFGTCKTICSVIPTNRRKSLCNRLCNRNACKCCLSCVVMLFFGSLCHMTWSNHVLLLLYSVTAVSNDTKMIDREFSSNRSNAIYFTDEHIRVQLCWRHYIDNSESLYNYWR